MAMTGSQFVTDICDIVGKSENAASVSGALLSARALKCVNYAQKRIARHYNFDELNAFKTDVTLTSGTKRYHWVDDLGLTNPKDIASIILDNGANSRRLERWLYRKFDKKIPRPEQYSNGKPWLYIKYGNYLEFFRIPDDDYTLRIRYPQWPTDLTADTTSDYENKDSLILAAGVFETYMDLQEYNDAKIWFEKVRGLMLDAVNAEGNIDWAPDGESESSYADGVAEPWLDPYAAAYDPLYGYPE